MLNNLCKWLGDKEFLAGDFTWIDFCGYELTFLIDIEAYPTLK
jgi:hypothetical protein